MSFWSRSRLVINQYEEGSSTKEFSRFIRMSFRPVLRLRTISLSRFIHGSTDTHRKTRVAAKQVPHDVEVCFSDGNSVVAQPGQNLYDVACDAGTELTLGCSSGSCGVCEMELTKSGALDGTGVGEGTVVVRPCIHVVPRGFARVHLNQMLDDDIWGGDATADM